MKISLELQPCLKTKSGIGIYTHEISKALQDINGLSIKGDIFNFINKIDISKHIEGLYFNIDTCRVLSYGIYRRIWNYVPVKYNHLFKDNADIYHFFDYIVPPRIDGRIITTVHDLTYKLYPNIMKQRTINRIKNDIEYSVNRADKIITVSKYVMDDIIKLLNINPDKIEIVPPGVNLNTFNRNYDKHLIDRIRKKYRLPMKYILFMGTLEPRKNIESIIEAFYLLRKESEIYSKDIKLVIAGKRGWMYNSIFIKVKELALENEVIFTDYVDEEDKPVIYKLAELFIFPSIYEGFGIPVLEAMASSIPVITSNVASLPEVVGDSAILIPPKDIAGMAEAMNRILKNIDLKNNLIAYGNEQIKKYSWIRSAEKLYEVYKSIL